MTERLKIFVGKNDSEELSRLGQESKEEGYETGNFLEQLKQRMPVAVSIRGGLAEYCVADTTKVALYLGATRVEIDLHKCRATAWDQGQGDIETTKFRRQALKRGLGILFVEDPKISILPPKNPKTFRRVIYTVINALYRRFT